MKKSTASIWVLVLALCSLYYAIQNGYLDNPNDNHSIVDPLPVEPGPVSPDVVTPDPISPEVNKASLSDCWLLVVAQSEAEKRPSWLQKNLDDFEFWRVWLVESNGVERASMDPDDKDAESYISSARISGISEPFWMLGVGTQPLIIKPFKEDQGTDFIKQEILKVAK